MNHPLFRTFIVPWCRLGLVLCFCFTPSVTPVCAAPPFEGATGFFEEHCTHCHFGEDPDGGLNLTSLDYLPEERDNFARWVKVHDRIKAGEMPPKGEARPDALAVASFVDGMASTLNASEQAIIAREGRAVQRRLNRYEYENTLRDLLDVPWVQVKDRLPELMEPSRFTGRCPEQVDEFLATEVEPRLSGMELAGG